MRRGVAIAAAIVTILAGIGIGVGAYRAGEDHGITGHRRAGADREETGQEGSGRAHRWRRVARVLPRVLPVPAVPDRRILPDRGDRARGAPGTRSLGARTRTVERRGPAPAPGGHRLEEPRSMSGCDGNIA